MAEHNQRFDTFMQWVNKAESWLTRRGPGEHAICFDQKGRVCRCGRDMMRARDDDAFPVHWVWPDQVPELILSHKCKVCDGTGEIAHPITSETQGPEVDAERRAWAERNKVPCPACSGGSPISDSEKEHD